MKLLTEPTPVALWHHVIQKAIEERGTPLVQEIESYLVFLLMRYINRPEFSRQIIANQFLTGLKCLAKQRLMILQAVGDQCLLFSGLYPGFAKKRLVKVSYFVDMGRSAYGMISSEGGSLFEALSTQFVTLMDVLQTVSQPALSPLEAYDLWNEGNSQRALLFLKQASIKGLPIKK